ncbi:MAG: hypothetical protein ACXW1T_08530 [Methylophilus sp.]|jgi:hypothetical protein
MKQNSCEKIILADSLGVRLIYCSKCEVVELELGSISVRLHPSAIQRIANIMMKASLKLDKVEHEITPKLQDRIFLH